MSVKDIALQRGQASLSDLALTEMLGLVTTALRQKLHLARRGPVAVLLDCVQRIF